MTDRPGGYAGQILRIDLGSGTIQEERLDPNIARRFIGGPGLAARFLYDEGPADKIVLMSGPLNGTQAISSPRYAMAARSPLNGFYASSSASGFFGTRLKWAGYDGLIIEGRAAKPTCLFISPNRVQLRSSEHLWGLTVSDTQRILREEGSGSSSIAAIGPAGERQVRYASVLADWRAHGRSGLGAVWGAKNLKAIVIDAPHRTIDVADPSRVRAFSQTASRKALENGSVERYRTYGTADNLTVTQAFGILPTRNFREGTFDGADRISSERVREMTVISRACNRQCPLQCEKISIVTEGPHAGALCRGPEYETLYALGALCGVDDLSAVVAAARACDDYGLDTMSTGAVIALAMELGERDLLTQPVSGIDLRFGSVETILALVHQIAYRQGLGDLLAEGTRRAAEQLGPVASDYAIHVKGVELAGYDPRGVLGMGLAYATASRGADHLRAWTIAAELFRPGADAFSPVGKAALVKEMQDFRSAVDASGLCSFIAKDQSADEMAALLTAVTGFDLSAGEFLQVGERIWNQERLLAQRRGIGRADDTLPRRLLEEALPDGPAAGRVIGQEVFTQMLDEYYALRGWDPESGFPAGATLARLGLEATAEKEK